MWCSPEFTSTIQGKWLIVSVSGNLQLGALRYKVVQFVVTSNTFVHRRSQYLYGWAIIGWINDYVFEYSCPGRVCVTKVRLEKCRHQLRRSEPLHRVLVCLGSVTHTHKRTPIHTHTADGRNRHQRKALKQNVYVLYRSNPTFNPSLFRLQLEASQTYKMQT